MTNLKDLEKTGRKAWLATVGTYAKGWEIISGKLNSTFEDTNQLVNDLIENGEKVEADLKAKIKSNTVLDEKIAELKIKLGVETSTDDKLAELNNKVDALVEAVAKVVEARATQQIEAKPAEKATAKPAAKKATAKPSTATKSTAKKAADTEAKTAEKPTANAKTTRTRATKKPATAS